VCAVKRRMSGSAGGRGEFESMYNNAGLLLMEIRTQLEELESNTSGENARIASGKLAANINALSRSAAELETQVQQENRGELWRVRVRQLGSECKALRDSLYAYMAQQDSRAREAEERAMLLEGRVSTPYSAMTERQTRLGYLIDESGSLARSNALADDIEEQGMEILDGLDRQRALMHGMRGKLGGLLGKLGLSRDVMKEFENRNTQDKLLVYGGMIGIVLLIIVLFFFFS